MWAADKGARPQISGTSWIESAKGLKCQSADNPAANLDPDVLETGLVLDSDRCAAPVQKQLGSFHKLLRIVRLTQRPLRSPFEQGPFKPCSFNPISFHKSLAFIHDCKIAKRLTAWLTLS